MALAHPRRWHLAALFLLLAGWTAALLSPDRSHAALVARQDDTASSISSASSAPSTSSTSSASSTSAAANPSSSPNPSSTFFYQEPRQDGFMAFTISAVQESSDLYFRMSAPVEYSWFGIGTGDRMKGSLMFIIYASSNKTGVTLSARRAGGNSEPTYDPSIQLEILDPEPGDQHPNGISGRQYFITARCKFCLRISDPNLDLTKTNHPWIFALGPSGERYAMNTDDKDAPLRRHELFGGFSMDMVAASTQSDDDVEIPPLGTQAKGAQMTGQLNQDRNQTSWTHGALMVFTFLILFPVGVFAVRVMERTNLHMWIQGIGVGIALVGMGLGCYLTPLFNRSKHFSAHQIIGVIVMAFLVAQFALGIVHHRKFMRTRQPTKLIKIHQLALGPVTILLGIANGGIGFSFAQNQFYLIPYIVLLVIVALALGGFSAWKVVRDRRRPKNPGNGLGAPPPPYDVATGSGGPTGGPPGQGGLYAGGAAGASPYGGGYTSFNATRSDIALQSMPSGGGGRGPQEEDMQPTQPRPMV